MGNPQILDYPLKFISISMSTFVSTTTGVPRCINLNAGGLSNRCVSLLYNVPLYYVSLKSHLHEKRNGYNKESGE